MKINRSLKEIRSFFERQEQKRKEIKTFKNIVLGILGIFLIIFLFLGKLNNALISAIFTLALLYVYINFQKKNLSQNMQKMQKKYTERKVRKMLNVIEIFLQENISKNKKRLVAKIRQKQKNEEALKRLLVK